ncbi:MAG: GH116 family glycosyl-hydrolase [Acidobacteriaceae bacterium]
MSGRGKLPRRDFLKQAAGVMGAASQAGYWTGEMQAQEAGSGEKGGEDSPRQTEITFPRVFEGRQLKLISFPLGGVGAGSLGLGGRGQLRDWEIFNRPNQGGSPAYAFPAVWVQSGNAKPMAHVLESRILPPYQGESGLGSNNAPGLSRLEGAKFSGAYPLAHIDFEDRRLPVQVELDAFSPFIPHDPDDSGLPVAVLCYRVTNPGSTPVKVGIAFAIDNPVAGTTARSTRSIEPDRRVNEYRSGQGLEGLLMSNSSLRSDEPMYGSFVLGALPDEETKVTYWRGWPKEAWWTAPLLYWDEFSKHGQLGAEPNPRNAVGALCQQRTVAPGESGTITFLLAWHFPNRTPEWCGWSAPPGKEHTVIGNSYAVRFKDAWEAAQYAASHLPQLERRTRAFADAFRESTLPDVVKEAASANLSTLASTTCFRTADGEFHGFEGSDDAIGCCFGNCTHVWSYETATQFLFPSFARSLRNVSFGYSEDDAGGIRARQLLPDGHPRFPLVAADGQMGQIMHAYLGWRLSGDRAWLEATWPKIKQAIAFAWEPGGWDPERSGVLTGAQHNTYDVEFYGANPLCGIYYLGALRAGEEMARAVGDSASAAEYRRIFEQGSLWIDAHLFNDEYYIQQIRGLPASKIAAHLRGGMGTEDTENPEYQVGDGCLIDQLMGQYLAYVANLGPLVSAKNVQKTLRSIYAYNYKRSLVDHDNVERTFALNREAAMVICDYGKTQRPRIPFPYFAEVMTGFEYATAALMIYSGMVEEGTECIHNVRARYDGEKRNPWDEAECGHHYARAMASWTSFVALSGFQYDGAHGSVAAVPRVTHKNFSCFWSTANGWGRFAYRAMGGGGTRFSLQVLEGTLSCSSCEISGSGSSASVQKNGETASHSVERQKNTTVFHFQSPIQLAEGHRLEIEVKA